MKQAFLWESVRDGVLLRLHEVDFSGTLEMHLKSGKIGNSELDLICKTLHELPLLVTKLMTSKI